jgi:DNA repair exonuclease SbcCD ATPase subunit
MGQESELNRLEQFVEKLLIRFTKLQKENARLSQELAARNATIDDLRGSLDTQHSERGEIRQRLGKIVAQIEAWEEGLDDDNAMAEFVADETAEIAPSIEEAESAEDDEDDEPEIVVEALPGETRPKAAEEEGRMQHNLFSMPQGRK